MTDKENSNKTTTNSGIIIAAAITGILGLIASLVTYNTGKGSIDVTTYHSQIVELQKSVSEYEAENKKLNDSYKELESNYNLLLSENSNNGIDIEQYSNLINENKDLKDKNTELENKYNSLLKSSLSSESSSEQGSENNADEWISCAAGNVKSRGIAGITFTRDSDLLKHDTGTFENGIKIDSFALGYGGTCALEDLNYEFIKLTVYSKNLDSTVTFTNANTGEVYKTINATSNQAVTVEFKIYGSPKINIDFERGLKKADYVILGDVYFK